MSHSKGDGSVATQNKTDAVRSDKKKTAKKNSPKMVVDRLVSKGKLYKADGAYYYVTADGIVCRINSDCSGIELQDAIDKEGISKGKTSLYKQTVEELKLEAYRHGTEAVVKPYSYYDPGSNSLYLLYEGSRVARITASTVTKAKQGDNGVILTAPPNAKLPPNIESLRHLLKKGVNPLKEYLFPHMFRYMNHDLTTEEYELLIESYMYVPWLEELLQVKPILVFRGDHGSGKTMAAKMIGKIFYGPEWEVGESEALRPDGFIAMACSLPFEVLDNLDNAQTWTATALCTSAGRSRVPKRALYTDNELREFNYRASFIITSRTPHFNRPDVASRTLVVTFQSPNTRDLCATDVVEELNQHRLEIWAYMIKRIQGILEFLEDNKMGDANVIGSNPRLDDFARLTVILAGLDNKQDVVNSLWRKMCQRQTQFSEEGQVLYDLIEYLVENDQPRWMTAKEVIQLASKAKEKGCLRKWPFGSTKKLGHILSKVCNEDWFSQSGYRCQSRVRASGNQNEYLFTPVQLASRRESGVESRNNPKQYPVLEVA